MKSLKAALREGLQKRLSPYGFINLLRLAYFGWKPCGVCKSYVRLFKDQGYRYPVLFEKQVVGGIPKQRDECPVCRSNSRTRLVFLYLDRVAAVGDGADVLQIAPERGLQLYLGRRRLGRYIVGDIVPERYLKIGRMLGLDITALPFADGKFDVVLCNHVLEHVPADSQAMGEIRRMLKPGGFAILQTPFSMRLAETDESETELSEDERIRRFGQGDHVRLYAKPDYLTRLRNAGFDVEEFWAWRDAPELAEAFAVDPLEPLFVCRPA